MPSRAFCLKHGPHKLDSFAISFVVKAELS
jgi:hypothetical protein